MRDGLPDTVLTDLVRLGCFAADAEVIKYPHATAAERTRVAVHAALTALLSQGYLTATDPDTWPKYFMPDSGPWTKWPAES